MIKTNKKLLDKFYKPREKNQYYRKYDFGFTFVIGGSEFYSRDPALSAMASLKSGVDKVRVIAPRRAADIIASFSPNVVAFPLEGKWFDGNHVSTLISMIESGKSVSRGNFSIVIGGGLGRSQTTQDAILDIISKISVPMVIDADAIHALAEKPEVIKDKDCLITPHSYEFYLLTGKKIFNLSQEEKIKAVKEEAKKLGATILLKDKPDIISDGEEVALNETGSPYMSVGGTGDVLAGIAGALLSRSKEFSPFLVAQAAAFISGKAGELAAKELKEGLSPTDVINSIPKVLH